MKIQYFGHSYLLISGGDYSIALDPYGDIGLIPPIVSADYVFSSHSHYDHNNFSVVKGAKLIDKSQGAFKVIPSFHDNEKGSLRGLNNILLFTLDGYTLAFMGDYGEYDNKEIIKALYGVDILFIPVGGKYTIDSKTAKYYVDSILPKTVVPIHYNIKGSTVDIKGVEEFLKLVNNSKIVSSPFEYNNESRVVVVRSEVKEDLWVIVGNILKNQQALKN